MTLTEQMQALARKALGIKSFSAASGYAALGYGLGTGKNNDLPRNDIGTSAAHTLSIAAYRAVDARMRAVGSMPWTVSDVKTGEIIDQSSEPYPTLPFTRALARAQLKLGHSLFSMWEMSMCITGKAYIEPVMNDVGNYTGLDWLNPNAVRIQAINGVIQRFSYSGGESGTVTYTPDELLYEKFPTLLSDYLGLAPLYVAMDRVNIELNTDKFLRSFFENNTQLGLIMTPKQGEMFSEGEVNRFQRQLQAGQSSSRAFKNFLSPLAVDIQTQERPDLSQDVDMIERVETAIYTALGVPRAVAGDIDNVSYQQRDEMYASFFQQTAIPRCRDIEQLVNTMLLPRFDRRRRVIFKFDTSDWDRLSATKQARWEATRTAYQDGVLTVNKYLEEFSKFTGIKVDPYENGDILMLPSSGIAVKPEQLGALQGKPSYITFQSPQTTIQQAGEMAQGAGIDNMPTPPPAETNPAGEAPAIIESGAANTPSPPARASQEDTQSELRTWRKYARKHGAGKALDFETFHLEDWQRSRIRFALADGTEEEAYKALDCVLGGGLYDNAYTSLYTAALPDGTANAAEYAEAHSLGIAAQKAIQATRIDYEDAVEDLLVEAVAGNIDRVRFGNRLRNLTQVAIGKAYLDGLEDGGITDPELTDEDAQWVGEWFAQQRKYIISLSDAIYKDDVVSEDEARGKPAMWYNKSIAPAYHEGLASASKNAAYEWVIGATEEHCRSCLSLNGQVRRMSYWKARILPQSSELVCKGFQCRCNLVPTRKRLSRGRLPAWKSHTHTH